MRWCGLKAYGAFSVFSLTMLVAGAMAMDDLPLFLGYILLSAPAVDDQHLSVEFEQRIQASVAVHVL